MNANKEVFKTLDNLQNIKLEAVILDGCLRIENEAKRRVPVDTGLLRNSITHEVYERGDEIVGVIGTNFDYAPYVEYGTGLFAEAGNGRQTPWSYQDADGKWHTTVGQHPQPYLRLAYDVCIKQIEKNIEDVINGVL